MRKRGKRVVIMGKMRVMSVRSDAWELKYSGRPGITRAILLFFCEG